MIDDLIIEFDEGQTLSDQYKPEALYLVQWFLRESVSIGFNGPILVPIPDYQNSDAYIGNVFQFLFSLLLKYQAVQSKSNK